MKISPKCNFPANGGGTLAGHSGRVVGYGGVDGNCPLIKFDILGVGHSRNALYSPKFFDAFEKEIAAQPTDIKRSICNYNFAYIPLTDLEFLDFPNEQPTKETKPMSNKVIDMVKSDTKEAAYRVASTQITNGVKTALIKLVEAKMSNKEQMEQFKSLLDSQVGDSIVAMVLGYGLMAVPKLKNDPRVQKLSEEFRIQGMADVGNMVMSTLTDSLMPLITNALSAIPEEPTVRVMSEGSETSEESEEAEEEEAPKRTARK